MLVQKSLLPFRLTKNLDMDAVQVTLITSRQNKVITEGFGDGNGRMLVRGDIL